MTNEDVDSGNKPGHGEEDLPHSTTQPSCRAWPERADLYFLQAAHREAIMARLSVDCRDYPSEMKCTVAISADSQKELIDAAVQHAVAVHGHKDSPQLREQIGKMAKTQ